MRASLDVPDGTGSPALDKQNTTAVEHNNNHLPESAMPEVQDLPMAGQGMQNGGAQQSRAAETVNGNEANKTDSLKRFQARRTGTAGSLNRSSAGSGGMGTRSSLEGERPVGVQLSDAPIDD